jgi:hypothetical protein
MEKTENPCGDQVQQVLIPFKKIQFKVKKMIMDWLNALRLTNKILPPVVKYFMFDSQLSTQ